MASLPVSQQTYNLSVQKHLFEQLPQPSTHLNTLRADAG